MNSTIPPVAQEVGLLRFVPANIRKLVAAGRIDEHAASLALQLIAKMQETGRFQVTRTLREACNTIVYLNDSPYAGPVYPDPIYMVGAIQQVHSYLGFFNHTAEVFLDDADPEAHFANDPKLMFGCHWTEDTPLVFRFDYLNMDYWSQIAREELAQAEKSATILRVDTRG